MGSPQLAVPSGNNHLLQHGVLHGLQLLQHNHLQGLQGNTCFTKVVSTGCRGVSAPVPVAPPHYPSSPTLAPARLFLSHFPSLSQLLHSIFTLSWAHCHRGATILFEGLGCACAGSAGDGWNGLCLAWCSPSLSSQRPPLQLPSTASAWALAPNASISNRKCSGRKKDQLLVVNVNREQKFCFGHLCSFHSSLNVPLLCLTPNINFSISASLSGPHTSFQQRKMSMPSPPVSFSVLFASMPSYPIREITFFFPAQFPPSLTLASLATFPAWGLRGPSARWAFSCFWYSWATQRKPSVKTPMYKVWTIDLVHLTPLF